MTCVQTRCAVALYLTILSAGPPALRAETGDCPKRAEIRSSVSGQGLISGLWALFLRVWEKEGSSVDPSGNHRPAPCCAPSSSNAGDEGSSADPSGRP